MKNDLSELRHHVERLEYRLDEFHEHFIDAVRERDELAIDAAWGVAQSVAYLVSSLTSVVLGILTYFIAAEFMGRFWSIGAAVLVWGIASWWGGRSLLAVNRSRIEEKQSLAKLPEWKSEAEKFW